jgi:hypothetical protein
MNYLKIPDSKWCCGRRPDITHKFEMNYQVLVKGISELSCMPIIVLAWKKTKRPQGDSNPCYRRERAVS